MRCMFDDVLDNIFVRQYGPLESMVIVLMTKTNHDCNKEKEKERVSSSLLLSTACGFKTEEMEWRRRDRLLLAHSGIAVRVGDANASRWSRRDEKRMREIKKIKQSTTH